MKLKGLQPQMGICDDIEAETPCTKTSEEFFEALCSLGQTILNRGVARTFVVALVEGPILKQ